MATASDDSGGGPSVVSSSQTHGDDSPTVVASGAGESISGGSVPRLDPHDLIAGELNGRYVVIASLGVGGMGEVVRAYDPRLRREVALKRLRSDVVDDLGQARLVREAQAMAALSHPNVVAIFDVEVGERGVTLAMEYVPGRTLRDWMRARQRKWAEAAPLFLAAGQALAAAHRAGLVHRDFKPANVLVGEDGSVKVTDFGLAKRNGGPEDESGSTDSVEVDHPELTRADTVMGSPAYMAPEQHVGPADARADQYSFCLSLWEALIGERPFQESGRELLAAKRKGPPPWPDPKAAPRRVVEAIRRGLQPEPEDRWPDMPSLLARLRSPTSRPRRSSLALGGIGVGLVATAAALGMARERPCTGGADRIAEVWNDGRAQELGQRLHDTGVPWASRLSERLRVDLDEHAAIWVETFTEACAATSIRGERSAAALDLEMACLERARVELDEVIKVLLEADADSALHAHELTSDLPRLAHCLDIEALGDEVSEPKDPAVAEAVSRAQRVLGRAEALREAGKAAAAKEALDTIAADDPARRHAGLRIELASALGITLDSLGEYEAAIQSQQEALRTALAEGQFEDAMISARELARVHGRRLDQFDRADAYLDVASGIQERDEIGPLERAATRFVAAQIELARGEFGRAIQAFEQARDLYAAELGPDSDRVTEVRLHLGDTLAMLGRTDDASREHRWVLEQWRARLGDEHPNVAVAYNNLGATMLRAGDFEEAADILRQAVQAYSRARGERHVATGFARDNLAFVLGRLERYEEAEIEHRAAVEIIAETLGADHRDVAIARDNRALVLRELGRVDEAEAEHRRALATFEKSLGLGHPDTLQSRKNLVSLLAELGRTEEAIALLETTRRQLLESDAASLGLARTERRLAELLKDTEPERALELMDGAWNVVSVDGSAGPGLKASTGFALAKMLWSTDRRRAHALAEQALELAGTEGSLKSQAAAIEAWLSEHPV